MAVYRALCYRDVMRLINRRLQTALDVLQVLAAAGPDSAPISRHVLAKRMHESSQWLGYVLTALARAGYVKGLRGAGFTLAPDAVTRPLRALFSALERDYVTSIVSAPTTASERVSLAIARLLERVSVGDAISLDDTEL